MKKYVLSFLIIIGAIAFSSYGPTNLVSFHYNLPSGGESFYENSVSWDEMATHIECQNVNTTPCIVRIDQSKLAPYSGTNSQKFAAYLAAQGLTSSDYTSATAAVNSLKVSTKF